MADDRTVPILPCGDIDAVIAFYEAIGFKRTYRQLKPYPCAVVEYGQIGLHFGGIEGFAPENSYGSCLVVTDDADALFAAFSAGAKAAFGRLPVAGIPRFTRPRKKRGVLHGFNIVDPGGNWIRVTQRKGAGDEAAEDEHASGLLKAVLTAARLGDAKGDPALAAKTLDRALAKAAGAPAAEQVSALVYRAELAMALSDTTMAQELLQVVRALELNPAERDAAGADLARAAELETDLQPS